MSVAEKIVYGVAGVGVLYGGYQAVGDTIERASIDDALETSLEQQAQAETQYRKENPEATQMPIDIQEGPAEYRSLLVQQSNELASEGRIDIAVLGIGASVLVGGLMRSYRRTALTARDEFEAATAQAEARYEELQKVADEVDAEHFAKVAELQGAIDGVQAYKKKITNAWDEAVERNLVMHAALDLAIDGHVSETGTPKEKILETADQLFAALAKYRENPETFDGSDLDTPATGQDAQPEAEQPVQPVAAETEEPVPEQPEPQPAPQTPPVPQTPQPAPQRTETATSEVAPAPARPAPPRVHRARRRPTA